MGKCTKSPSLLVAGHEELYPASWMTQKRSTRPHLQRYHLLPRHISRADAERFGWMPPPALRTATRAGYGSVQIILH